MVLRGLGLVYFISKKQDLKVVGCYFSPKFMGGFLQGGELVGEMLVVYTMIQGPFFGLKKNSLVFLNSCFGGWN